MKRREKAAPEKYEGKVYLSYSECQDYLGVGQSKLNVYIAYAGVRTHKFFNDRKRYLSIEDVKSLSILMASPWKAQEVQPPASPEQVTEESSNGSQEGSLIATDGGEEEVPEKRQDNEFLASPEIDEKTP